VGKVMKSISRLGNTRNTYGISGALGNLGIFLVSGKSHDQSHDQLKMRYKYYAFFKHD
jgi:hypothetical protein